MCKNVSNLKNAFVGLVEKPPGNRLELEEVPSFYPSATHLESYTPSQDNTWHACFYFGSC